jgi:hypothetical protein
VLPSSSSSEVERETTERKKEQVEIIRTCNKDLKEKVLGKKKAEVQIIDLKEEENGSEWKTISSDADDNRYRAVCLQGCHVSSTS